MIKKSNCGIEVKAITKEIFLYNTTDEEVFCVLHEFKERLNELRKEQDNKLVISDEEIGIIAEQMITATKGSRWL